MAEMLEVLALMAAPVTILLALRWHVIRQNRAAAAAEKITTPPV